VRSRLVAAVVALGAAACTASDPPPAPYDLPLPPGFPPMAVPADNPTTEPGVALGRQLYHDVRLSPDGRRACASCHRQDRAFTDPAAPGVLPHVNLAWSRNFLWDGRFVGTLEEAMVMEVEDFFQTDVARLAEPDLEAMFAGRLRHARDHHHPRRLRAGAVPAHADLSGRRALRPLRGPATPARSTRASAARIAALLQRARRVLPLPRAPGCSPTTRFHNIGLDSRRRRHRAAAPSPARPAGRRALEDPDPAQRRAAPARTCTTIASRRSSRSSPSTASGVALSPTPSTRSCRNVGGIQPHARRSRPTWWRSSARLTDEAFVTDPRLGPPP
jgi:hypothetical protein